MNFNNSRLVDHKPMKFGTFVPYMYRFVIIVFFFWSGPKNIIVVLFFLSFFFLRHESKISNLLIETPYQRVDRPAKHIISRLYKYRLSQKSLVYASHTITVKADFNTE